MRKIFLILSLFVSLSCEAQSLVPMGTYVPRAYSVFNDVSGWWRADTFTGSSGSYSLTDLSNNAHPMVQQAGTLTAGTGVNSKAKFTGNASAYLNSSLNLKSWPVTVITVALRANNATCGFFGHIGVTGTNTLWYGYEATNSNTIYNFSGSSNTTSEAGTIAVYTARIGHVSRVTMVNGTIQPTMSFPTVVQSGLAATSIGTQYRGLNEDWYETLVWDRLLTLDDLDEVNTYLNSRYAISVPLWSSYTQVKTIIDGGQSNAAGRAIRGASDANIPSPYNASMTGCNVWFGSPSSSIGTAFSTLDVTTNNHMLGEELTTNPANFFGFELTMAKDYITAHGGSVYLMKFAIGGSSLARSASLNYWAISDPTDAINNSKKKSWYFYSNWWQMLRVMQAASQKPQIVGYPFYQGEQDATNSTDANNYEANLTLFIKDSRAELGFTAANVPFYIVRIHKDEDIVDQPYRDTVRGAQQNVAAAVSNCFLVSVDTYPLKADNIHINHVGQLALGTALAGQF